jgi:hypothetical protein
MKVIDHVLPPLTWHIFQIMIDVLFSVVNVYVLNQSCGHYLLFDALNVTIVMSLKLKEESENLVNL